MKKLILLIILLCSNSNAQLPFDSLVFKLQAYGTLSYIIPIDATLDPLTGFYSDSSYFWIIVDSLPIDSSLNSSLGFGFTHVTQNMWMAHTTFTDTGRTLIVSRRIFNSLTCSLDTIIDTTRTPLKTYPVTLIHIVPEGAPAWIKDIRGN